MRLASPSRTTCRCGRLQAGARGAGMHNHSDYLLSSSWHAHLTGRKWWMVCGYDKGGTQRCFEDYLVPGEILYYGPREAARLAARLAAHEEGCRAQPCIARHSK